MAMWLPFALCYRELLAFRRQARQFITLRLIDPLVYFFGISIGFGHLIATQGGVDYKTFIFPGFMAIGCLYLGVIQGAHIAFWRMELLKMWQAMLATPMRLRDIMMGEMLTVGAKTILVVMLLSLVGVLLGIHFSWVGLLLSLPVFVLGSFAHMAIAYNISARAHSMDDFDIVWLLLITPQITLCGAMFSTDHFPDWLSLLIQIFPITHVIEVARPLLLQTAELLPVLGHVSVLVLQTGIFFALAHYQFKKRLFA
ncbi:MAG: hypothetical protein COY40_03935 [Alphaproteobacteria bacterium CG_4_10_14_0_8_um_filter_53_9]|nr:MAG: hypothetical protein COY40_03935 [Alphaproteobacteria bacterium CG_4_10_14_0_8_um_filter_53_9]